MTSDGTLVLYHTSGCHLCEQALALVAPLAARHGRVLQQVDIADSESLVDRYGTRIPVLYDPQGAAELGWPFDAGQVLALLGR